jgi:hypothetical protein
MQTSKVESSITPVRILMYAIKVATKRRAHHREHDGCAQLYREKLMKNMYN